MHALENSHFLGLSFRTICGAVCRGFWGWKEEVSVYFFERKKGDNFGNQRLLSLNFLSSKLLQTFYSIWIGQRARNKWVWGSQDWLRMSSWREVVQGFPFYIEVIGPHWIWESVAFGSPAWLKGSHSNICKCGSMYTKELVWLDFSNSARVTGQNWFVSFR